MSLRLVRRKGRPHWFIRGTVRGERIFESTGVAEKARAEEILSQRQAQIIERSIHGDGPSLPFIVAVDEYRAHQERSEGTKAFVARLVDHFEGKTLREITKAEIHAGARALYPNVSDATRNRNYYTPLLAILHLAEELHDGYVVPRVRRPKEPRPQNRALSPTQERAVLAAARDHDPTVYAFLLLLFDTGVRLSEATGLHWSTVDLEARHFDVYQGKQDRWRRCYIEDDLVVALANLPTDRGGLVFPWETKYRMQLAVNPVREKSGVDFTPHMCRHTWATRMMEATGNLRLVQEAGGWADLKNVVRYANIGQDQAAEAMRTVARRRR